MGVDEFVFIFSLDVGCVGNYVCVFGVWDFCCYCVCYCYVLYVMLEVCVYNVIGYCRGKFYFR